MDKINFVSPPDDKTTGIASLAVSDAIKIKEMFSELEKKVFEYVMYPRITYRNRQLLSCEDRDKDFIEGVFMDLYSCFEPYFCHRIKFVIQHYESYYKACQRVYKIKQLDNFYSIAVRHLFFYAYEINSKIQDDKIRINI